MKFDSVLYTLAFMVLAFISWPSKEAASKATPMPEGAAATALLAPSVDSPLIKTVVIADSGTESRPEAKK